MFLIACYARISWAWHLFYVQPRSKPCRKVQGEVDAGVACPHAHEAPGTKARALEPPAKLTCSFARRALWIVGWASVLVEDQAMSDNIHGPWSKRTKSIGI